jgi:hypothetical protein
MVTQRIVSPNYLGIGLAIATGIALGLGSTVEAQAQLDPNIQSRIDVYTIPLVPSISGFQQFGGNVGACLSDAVFVLILYRDHRLMLPTFLEQMDDHNIDPNKNQLVIYLSKSDPGLAAQILATYFRSNPDNAKHADEVRKTYFLEQAAADKFGKAHISATLHIQVAPSPTPFCHAGTAAKIIVPSNPTYETNVLKSNANNSRGMSFGLGGTFQVTAPGLMPEQRPFDVVGFSAGSQSVRYDPFPSRSVDTATTQGAYQFFIDAFGFQRNGESVANIDGHTDKGLIPPVNMITVDTVSFGFQNQTVFTPTFHAETVNLFTPQVTLSRQNMSLNGSDWCNASIPDPRKIGFCYYTDLLLAVGQTFSDMRSQQNANVTASLAPGWRIDNTDLKLALPITATARAYEDVTGGRRDVLLQVGPAVTYTPPPMIDKDLTTSVTFTLSATYNRNYSTITADSWHGLIVMQTLSLAFLPASH